jgi:hypothetical protein
MKFASGSRRSIHYSIFIGVLAGSVFSGSGAFANPTPVNSVQQLLGVTGNTSYVLTTDLDLSTAVATDSLEAIQLADVGADVFIEGAPVFEDGIQAVGSTTYISGAFTGILDGGGFTISGLTKPLFDTVSGEVRNLNLATAPCDAGVCGVAGRGALANTLGADGTVDNVDVTGHVNGNVYIEVDDGVGGLVGTSSGSISGSTVNGDVNGYNGVGGVGGLVGRLESGATITDSHTTSNQDGSGVTGSVAVGGLVGYSEGSITTSTASGPVSGVGDVADDENRDIGGLVGVLESGATITGSSASGYVSGGLNAGGLVGWSDGDITGSHATGDVVGVFDEYGEIIDEGDHGIGGLVGYSSGYISDSHAEGNVDGFYQVGGLVGSTGGGDVNITNSYATGDVSGVDNIGGLVGLLDQNHSITYSHATGDVTGSGEYIGGLVGWLAFGASISNSYANTGTVTGTGTDEDVFDEYGEIIDEGDHGIGGLVGYSSGYISDSHAEGNVDGFYQVGGLVGSTGVASYITNSYAKGEVTGGDEIGGLVGRLDEDHEITNSYATGDVTGDDDIGGLVGWLALGASISNSYATGDVIGTEGGDIGGLVGYSRGFVTNTHATGDVTGVFDVGGLVGDLQPSGEIRNSYATGTVSANGSDGGWRNGWGGLVGEFSGLIENSFATGNVVADYNAGALVGYSYAQEEEDTPEIINSFATGEVFGANNDVVFGEESIAPEDWQQGLGGFVGCKELYDIETSAYSCDLSGKEFPPLNQETILSIVNSAAIGFEEEDPAFEIVACKNYGLPLLSILDASYANTCPSNPPAASVSAVLASVVQLNPKFNLLESTTLRLFLYLAGDDTIRITVEDFVVLGVTGVNKANLPVLLKLLKDVDLFTLDLKTINKNVKIADELLKKKKKK